VAAPGSVDAGSGVGDRADHLRRRTEAAGVSTSAASAAPKVGSIHHEPCSLWERHWIFGGAGLWAASLISRVLRSMIHSKLNV
jgi:hypothetical protein